MTTSTKIISTSTLNIDTCQHLASLRPIEEMAFIDYISGHNKRHTHIHTYAEFELALFKSDQLRQICYFR